MKSDMARDDFDELRDAGLAPTFDDAVRLNALALKVEADRFAGAYDLPRVAFLGRLSFREPTVGHSLFVDSVLSWADDGDLSTITAVYAYALSRPQDALPDPNDRERTRDEIDRFTTTALRPFTLSQIQAALVYAQFGSDATAREYPPPRPKDDGAPAAAHDDDALLSMGAGVLFETVSVGLGLSVRDVCGLTVSKARRLQSVALVRAGINEAKTRRSTAIGDYYAALDEIRARLTRERDAAAATEAKEASPNG